MAKSDEDEDEEVEATRKSLFNIFAVQDLIISGFLGYTYHSWWVFGGVLIVLLIIATGATMKVKMSIVNAIILATAWGYVGYKIGPWFGSGIVPIIVTTTIGFLIGFIGNYVYDESEER